MRGCVRKRCGRRTGQRDNGTTETRGVLRGPRGPRNIQFARTQINAKFCCLFVRVSIKGVLGLFPAFAGFVQLCYHGDMSWFAIMLLPVYVMFHNSVLK